MRPDRMGRSKWQRVLPWHYTAKRKRSRQDLRAEAIRFDRTVTASGVDLPDGPDRNPDATPTW